MHNLPNTSAVFQLSMKRLAFNALTTPNKETGLSHLQSACIEGDIETVNAIFNCSPDKLDSAIASSVKIGPKSPHFAGKSILTALRQLHSEKHMQTLELVDKVTKDFQSQSLLHLAAKRGHVEHLHRLLDVYVGEHVNSVLPGGFHGGETPLMLAARFNESNVVEFLVQAGASLEMQDADAFTPFLHAAMGGKVENILRLIELGANTLREVYGGISAIHLAAENGHTEAVSFLLEHGANVNAVDRELRTPLMLSAQNGHLETVDLLLKNGANVNQIDDDRRWLPLHYAAEEDHAEVVKFLIQKGGNLSAKSHEGTTVLHLATCFNLVIFLVEQGADVRARDWYGKTPLHMAAAKGQSETVNYLLNQGSCINSLDNSGFSALYYAVKAGHIAAAKVLIARGCDFNLTNRACCDVLRTAASKGSIDVLRLFLDRGIPVDTACSYYECPSMVYKTPLMIAADAGQYDTVAFLLDRGASINGFDAAKAASSRSCAFPEDIE